MTKPFVGRCSQFTGNASEISAHDLEILGEILKTETKDVELLIDLVKDSESGTIFRECALDRICVIYHEIDNGVREALLSLIDQILTYDENGLPIEKSEDLRRMAFVCVCSMYSVDDVEGYSKWEKRVASDPSNVIRWLASLSHG